MNSKVKGIMIFVSGVVSGAAGMFVFMKNKWGKEFDKKTEEMIEYYESKKPEDKKIDLTHEGEPEQEVRFGKAHVTSDEAEEYEKTIVKQNYSAISTNSSERTKNTSPTLIDDEYSVEPYEITSMDFGSQEMYDMVTLYLYENGEIRMDCGFSSTSPVNRYKVLDEESIENYIGTKLLQKFADMRDSDPDLEEFYVRNDRLKTDFEILITSEN